MPKDIKIVKLDPLSEKLDNVNMKGGASKKLSKEAKSALKAVVKQKLKFDKQTMAAGKEEILVLQK